MAQSGRRTGKPCSMYRAGEKPCTAAGKMHCRVKRARCQALCRFGFERIHCSGFINNQRANIVSSGTQAIFERRLAIPAGQIDQPRRGGEMLAYRSQQFRNAWGNNGGPGKSGTYRCAGGSFANAEQGNFRPVIAGHTGITKAKRPRTRRHNAVAIELRWNGCQWRGLHERRNDRIVTQIPQPLRQVLHFFLRAGQQNAHG